MHIIFSNIITKGAVISMEKNREIGLKIAYYRKCKRLTQAELARKINISTSYMGKIECGALKKGVTLPILFLICKELDIEPGELLSLSNQKKEPAFSLR